MALCNFLDKELVMYPQPPTESCKEPEIGLIGNAESEAVFFVFTGVISFLYATVMIAVYMLADRQYLDHDKAPLVDFLVTVLLAVFWIAGASAWAHGVSTLSTAIDVKGWLEVDGSVCDGNKYTCSNYSYSSVSKLVISVLFGFINFVLWSGNIWFLYKETAMVLNGVRFGGGSQAPQISSGGTA
ncbi:Synaptoporin [Orchesella cincta]|uniref:Synaptoporin n=1 Tax=Orchesella cincta TaxID=48709 RepID=A0A1D2NFV6_ORCCI|nr:Synaptoporin [Orchesella cincta]